jgi:hypothetical protein
MKSFLSLKIAMLATCSLSLFAQGVTVGAGSLGTLPAGRLNVQVIPLKQLSFSADVTSDVPLSTIAFDTNQVYISTPDGVVLGANSLASDLKTIYQASNTGISNLYVYNHVLYVLTNPHAAESDWHAMFQSKDQGATFNAIDNGLQRCTTACYYLVANQLFAQGNMLFSNAGGGRNLLVSGDEGETWSALSGEVDSQICYASPFEIVGRTVLQGGECPLDQAFLSRGMLNQNELSLKSNLAPVQMPDLSNRKINDIRHQPGTSTVLASAEGALLRSVNDGRSWETVFEEPSSGGFYPYMPNILFSSQQPRFVLTGGFDKGGDTLEPFLAYSSNGGAQWTDITSLLGKITNGTVTDLKEDTHGRLIAIVVDAIAKTVTIDEVRIQR